MTCTVPGCDRKTVAKGMCMRHYKQARASAEVGVELRIGEPSGHGRFGVMHRGRQNRPAHPVSGERASLLPALGVLAPTSPDAPGRGRGRIG